MVRRLKAGAILIVLTLLLGAGPVSARDMSWSARIRALAGSGAVMVTDEADEPWLAHHPDTPMIPASTLKVVTAGAALATLGPDYRFATDFHLSPDGDLYVVGRGDPYLVSEELAHIAQELKARGLRQVGRILLDNRFFAPGLVLHGTNRSFNPYDAYNGALCVNFNTIHALIGADGRVAAAEPQTPLTDLARQSAARSGLKGRVRFNLSDNPETCLVYAGDLLKAFLEQAGIRVRGPVQPTSQDPGAMPLFYRHRSRKSLAWLVSQVFKYSNNFMANQIFLTLGAEVLGPPATADKSRRVVTDYLTSHGIPAFYIEEGSGLSRRTRIKARQMIAVLKHFKPYRELLNHQGRSLLKTGTLKDVKTMAGYLLPSNGQSWPFAILLEGSTVGVQDRNRILSLLQKNLP